MLINAYVCSAVVMGENIYVIIIVLSHAVGSHWLIPTPCPYPEVRKEICESVQLTVKLAERRPKRSRIWRPFTTLLPT